LMMATCSVLVVIGAVSITSVAVANPVLPMLPDTCQCTIKVCTPDCTTTTCAAPKGIPCPDMCQCRLAVGGCQQCTAGDL
jgi:hypothetical protein